MSKIITCTEKGIIIYYENENKSQFVHYEQNQQSNIQRFRNKQEEDSCIFNVVQETMYQKLIRGTGYYCADELRELPISLITTIKNRHEKAQFLVRKLRVDIYFKAETKLLNVIFPYIKLGTKMNDYYEGCTIPNTVTNLSLGITKKVMVDTFIENKLLPSNFYEINVLTIIKSI